jgi:hypothetical protein
MNDPGVGRRSPPLCGSTLAFPWPLGFLLRQAHTINRYWWSHAPLPPCPLTGSASSCKSGTRQGRWVVRSPPPPPRDTPRCPDRKGSTPRLVLFLRSYHLILESGILVPVVAVCRSFRSDSDCDCTGNSMVLCGSLPPAFPPVGCPPLNNRSASGRSPPRTSGARRGSCWSMTSPTAGAPRTPVICTPRGSRSLEFPFCIIICTSGARGGSCWSMTSPTAGSTCPMAEDPGLSKVLVWVLGGGLGYSTYAARCVRGVDICYLSWLRPTHCFWGGRCCSV